MNHILPQASHADGMRSIPKQYAALPWRLSRDGFLEVLLVTSLCGGRWMVPSGWQVAGCSPSRLAEREAFAGAGAIGRAGPESIGSYQHVRPREDGSSDSGHVTVFGLHVLATLANWPEKDQRKRRWWPIEDACKAVGEPGLAELLSSLESHSPKDPACRVDRSRQVEVPPPGG